MLTKPKQQVITLNRKREEMAKLTLVKANKVWDLLVSEYGTRKEHYDRDSFCNYLCQEQTTHSHEYRFGGIFGMGGKIRLSNFRGLSADYYPESRTEILDKKMAELNSRLKEICQESD